MGIFTVYWNVIESNVLGKVSRRAEARGPTGRTKRCLPSLRRRRRRNMGLSVYHPFIQCTEVIYYLFYNTRLP